MTRLLPLLLCLLLTGVGASAPSVSPLEEFPDGILLELKGASLRVVLLGDSLARVAYAKDPSFFEAPSLAVPRPLSPFTDWTLEEGTTKAILKTPRMGVEVSKNTGLVRFLDPAGNQILAEASGGRALIPTKVQGANTFHVRQRWSARPDESLYGLGQHQLGILDWKGHDLDLWQRNTTAVVPFLVSSRGYGILWDNPSFTRFGDLREFTPIPPKCLSDQEGKPGGLTLGTAGSGTTLRVLTIQGDLKGKKWDEKPKALVWSGFLTSNVTGEHQFDCYSNGGLMVWLNGDLVMDQWRQGWLTEHDRAKVFLKAAQKVPLRVQWDTEQGSTLDFRWKTPNPSQDTSLWSEVGDGMDYTFVYGPSLDKVLAGYRTLTGPSCRAGPSAFGNPASATRLGKKAWRWSRATGSAASPSMSSSRIGSTGKRIPGVPMSSTRTVSPIPRGGSRPSMT
jgi:alpha-D-xyloside xylohydrolase